VGELSRSDATCAAALRPLNPFQMSINFKTFSISCIVAFSARDIGLLEIALLHTPTVAALTSGINLSVSRPALQCLARSPSWIPSSDSRRSAGIFRQFLYQLVHGV
jgi:hypothetical protein